MDFLRSVKGRLTLAALALVVLVLFAPGAHARSLMWGARALLSGVTLLLLAVGAVRLRAQKAPEFRRRLTVEARAALSPKCQVALIEADGACFLIVHGEGFAEIRASVPKQAADARFRSAALLAEIDQRACRSPQ